MSELKYRQILRIALTIFAVQFINALEYMMVTPLFPFMAEELGQQVSQAGYVASSYTLASVVSGLIGFFFLDRFNKRKILYSCLFIIGALTCLIPSVTSFQWLLFIRFVTGLFGGVVLGVAMALLLDLIPQELRAKMIALVLLAFPVVSIIGLPLILWLAEIGHWHNAFYLLSVCCFGAILMVRFLIPLSDHHDGDLSAPKMHFNVPMVLGAALPGISNLGTFMLIPLLVPIYQILLKMSAVDIPWLFFTGGIGAFMGTKISGKLHHHCSKTRLLLGSSGILLLSMVYLCWMIETRWFAYSFSFLVMFATYLRFTTITIICANIPSPNERSGFNALQSAFTHLSASIAFIVPAVWLRDSVFDQEVFISVLYWVFGFTLLLLPAMWVLKFYRQDLFANGDPSAGA